MIPPLRKSLKSCRAHKSAALDLESGAHAPLNQSNLLLGVLGYRTPSFRSKRHGDFYDSFVRGERGFTVGFGERSRGLLETSRVVKSKRHKSVKPRGSVIVWDGTWSQPGCVYQVLTGTVLTAVASTHSASFPSTNANVWMFNVFLLSLITSFKCFGNQTEKISAQNCIDLQTWCKC